MFATGFNAIGINRDSLSTTLSNSAHITFVIETLGRLADKGEHQPTTQHSAESTAGEVDTNRTGSAEQIRDELGRVAYAVGA